MNRCLARSLYRSLRKSISLIDADPVLRAIITVPYTYSSSGSELDEPTPLIELRDRCEEFPSNECEGKWSHPNTFSAPVENAQESTHGSHQNLWKHLLFLNGDRHYYQPGFPSSRRCLLSCLREIFDGGDAMKHTLPQSSPQSSIQMHPHSWEEHTMNHPQQDSERKQILADGLKTLFYALRFFNQVLEVSKPTLIKPLYAPPKYCLKVLDYPLTVFDPRDKDSDAISAQFLIAHPMETSMRHGVILLSIHGEVSMGWLVNTPLLTNDGLTMTVGKVLGNTHTLFAEHLSDNIVMAGGPVESPRDLSKDTAIFVLHRVEGVDGSSLVCPGIWGCSNLDNLQLAFQQGRARSVDVMVLMGYCGWSAGQLNSEMRRGVWWCVSSEKPTTTQSIMFQNRTSRSYTHKKRRAIKENPARTWCEVLGSLSPDLLDLTRLVTVLPPPIELSF